MILRTPDDRFTGLPEWPFTPRYLEIDDRAHGRLRMHYVDEGARAGAVVLLVHGEPTWSYLYRRMIPPLVAVGLRVQRHIPWARGQRHVTIANAGHFVQDDAGEELAAVILQFMQDTEKS